MKGKQTWKPKFGNKIAYLSTMCRDKTQMTEAHYFPKSIGDNIHKELVGSLLMLDHVKFSPVPLSITPPFSQVSIACFYRRLTKCFSLVVVILLFSPHQKMNANLEHNSHEFAKCIDIRFSFECKCKPGFIGHGFEATLDMNHAQRKVVTCYPEYHVTTTAITTTTTTITTATTTSNSTTTATTPVTTSNTAILTTTTTTKPFDEASDLSLAFFLKEAEIQPLNLLSFWKILLTEFIMRK